MKSRMLLLVMSALVLIAAPASAQTPVKDKTPKIVKPSIDPLIVVDGKVVSPNKPGPGSDPLAGAFFPPELVMQHQQKLALTEPQRTAIVQAMQRAQPRFIELQWQLQAEMEALSELAQAERPEEARVLQQLDRVLELERQTKRTQIEMLLRIKSTLTEAQQEQLRALAPVTKRAPGLIPPPPPRR